LAIILYKPCKIFSVCKSNIDSYPCDSGCGSAQNGDWSRLTKVKLATRGGSRDLAALAACHLGSFSPSARGSCWFCWPLECSKYSVENFRVLFKSRSSSLQTNYAWSYFW